MSTVATTTEPLPAPDRRRRIRWWMMLAAAGFLLRAAIWLISDGSNDADYHRYWAREIPRIGLVTLYQQKFGVVNHPPLSGYYAASMMWISDRTGIFFPILMKIPMLLADVLVAVLLWKIWAQRDDEEPPGAWPPRRGSELAAIAIAAYAWNLDAILVSAFHCNTDSIYAALCLLSAYLLDRRGWNFLGGLALAGAMNAKVIPLILIPPLLLQYRSLKPAIAFCAGLAVGMIPFYPFFYLIPRSFWRNVFSYKPVPSLWGFNFALLELIFHDVAVPYVRSVMDRYLDTGRWMVMGVMVLLGLIARRRRWSRYELCAACQAMFLVIAPGFGVQYTVLVAPMLCALVPGMGLLYGTAAGAFIGLIYWHYRVGGFPIASRFTGGFPEYAAVFGLVVWMILIVYVVRQLRRPAPRGAGRGIFPPIPSTALPQPLPAMS